MPETAVSSPNSWRSTMPIWAHMDFEKNVVPLVGDVRYISWKEVEPNFGILYFEQLYPEDKMVNWNKVALVKTGN